MAAPRDCPWRLFSHAGLPAESARGVCLVTLVYPLMAGVALMWQKSYDRSLHITSQRDFAPCLGDHAYRIPFDAITGFRSTQSGRRGRTFTSTSIRLVVSPGALGGSAVGAAGAPPLTELDLTAETGFDWDSVDFVSAHAQRAPWDYRDGFATHR